VHMGDRFVTHFPFVYIEAGGSLNGMLAAVRLVMTRNDVFGCHKVLI